MGLFGKSRGDRIVEAAIERRRTGELVDKLSEELLEPFQKLVDQQAEPKAGLDSLRAQIEEFPRLVGQRAEAYSIEKARKFEYAIASTDTEGFSSNTLDLWGSLGWEMVSSSAYAIGGSTQRVHFQYTFKREKLSLPDEELKLLGTEHEARVAMISELEKRMLGLGEQAERFLDQARSVDPSAPEVLTSLAKRSNKPESSF